MPDAIVVTGPAKVQMQWHPGGDGMWLQGRIGVVLPGAIAVTAAHVGAYDPSGAAHGCLNTCAPPGCNPRTDVPTAVVNGQPDGKLQWADGGWFSVVAPWSANDAATIRAWNGGAAPVLGGTSRPVWQRGDPSPVGKPAAIIGASEHYRGVVESVQQDVIVRLADEQNVTYAKAWLFAVRTTKVVPAHLLDGSGIVLCDSSADGGTGPVDLTRVILLGILVASGQAVISPDDDHLNYGNWLCSIMDRMP